MKEFIMWLLFFRTCRLLVTVYDENSIARNMCFLLLTRNKTFIRVNTYLSVFRLYTQSEVCNSSLFRVPYLNEKTEPL